MVPLEQLVITQLAAGTTFFIKLILNNYIHIYISKYTYI